jgi:hypothetical protein
MTFWKPIVSAMLLLGLVCPDLTAQHTQLPNNGFERWPANTTDKSTTSVPEGWHSFSDNAGKYSSMSNTNSSARSTSHVKGSYSCKIIARHVNLLVYHVNANGALTTGQMIVNSTSPTNDGNYIFSDVKNQYGHKAAYSFTGRPDSVSIWVKFERSSTNGPNKERSFKATFKAHLHRNVPYKDVPSHTMSVPQAGKVGNVYGEMASPNSSTTTTYTTSWKKFAFPFVYYDADNKVIANPTLGNTTAPTHILASFSTNKKNGGGCYKDALYIDELWCRYNKKLSYMRVGGYELSAPELAALNAEAYASADGDGANTGGVATYIFLEPITGEVFPIVYAEAESGLIRGIETLHQASRVEPYTELRVEHNDGSYYTFIVRFTNSDLRFAICGLR